MNENSAGCLAGFVGCLFGLVFMAVILLLSGWILSRIGRKFGVGSFWGYCVPIYNLYLLCKCAEITPLWILGLMIPLVNIAATVYLWGTLAARLGKDFWLWGLLCAFLGIPVLILAFDDSEPVPDPVLPFE